MNPRAALAAVAVTFAVLLAAASVATPSSAAVPGAEVVKINEVESNGGTPGDWVELVNTGAGAVDLSNWVVNDNDDTHVFTIPAATSIGGWLPRGRCGSGVRFGCG
jgi:hypothetical protein